MKKSLLPQKRRRSREIALQVIYALDIRKHQTPEEALDLFPSEGEEPGVFEYSSILVKGVWEKKDDIDSMVLTYVTGWRPERMVRVDRAVLRLALYECMFGKHTPVAVAISEAVELAKTFGTEESGRFVNGVLGRIIRAIPAEENGNIASSDS